MKKYENFCTSLKNMKEMRNNVTHSYNEKIALGIVRQAKAIFYDLFVQLKLEIDANWL